MNNISAFINAHNEESEIPSLIENLKGIDDIVLIDHKSTDKTAELAKSFGAKVITRPYISDLVVQDDVDDFVKRFGYKPMFYAGDMLINDAAELNEGIKNCRHDWVLYLDCDERVTWDMKEIQKLMPDHDVIQCKFINAHNEDKSEKSSFVTKKLFRKDKVWFTCRIHGMIYGYELREVVTDSMQIDHWQKEKDRTSYLSRLEYAFLKEQSSRMNFYLGREYFHQRKWEHSLKLLNIYLQNATYIPEISKAYTIMSGDLWELGKHEESFVSLFQSMRVCPTKMAFDMMSRMLDATGSQYVEVWRKLRDTLPTEYF
jgi:glycosyltransferase involved in cell wall biosynthesis